MARLRLQLVRICFGGVERRRATLRIARAGRHIRCWLQTGWRRVLLFYLFAAALVCLHVAVTLPASARFDPHPLRWFFTGKSGPWIQAIVLAALLSALRGAWRMRKRIVILPFSNLTGAQERAPFVDGLPRRLMTLLAEIAD